MTTILSFKQKTTIDSLKSIMAFCRYRSFFCSFLFFAALSARLKSLAYSTSCVSFSPLFFSVNRSCGSFFSFTNKHSFPYVFSIPFLFYGVVNIERKAEIEIISMILKKNEDCRERAGRFIPYLG